MNVSNRELLRNYKTLKEKLIRGYIDEITIPQPEGLILKVVVETPETVAEKWLKKVKKIKPIYIERPEEDLF
jgi:hypothetical protein